MRPAAVPITPWPHTFAPDDGKPRFPDPDRVRYFEGLTVRDFERHLPHLPERTEVLARVRNIIDEKKSGDHNRIDPLHETLLVGNLFYSKEDLESLSSIFWEGHGPKVSYPHLLPFSITREDANTYAEEELFDDFRAQREKWKKRASVIRANFGYSDTEHAFAALIDEIPVHVKETMRSLPVFDDFSSHLVTALPQVLASKKLKVLYPGSGSHIAPLVTALRLIDAGQIDEALYIYTEIDEDHLERLELLLLAAERLGIFERVLRQDRNRFKDGGTETFFTIHYRGHPLRILFALNRSKNYYREEYLRPVDWVILHDLSGLQNSYKLLADVLMTRRSFSDAPQIVTMEGQLRGEPWFRLHFPSALNQTMIPGQYGHCEDLSLVGEISNCSYQSARSFLLNDSSLVNLANAHQSTDALTASLFEKIASLEIDIKSLNFTELAQYFRPDSETVIAIISLENCPACETLKQDIRKMSEFLGKVDFVEFMVHDDTPKRIKDRLGVKTFPTLLMLEEGKIKSRYIGYAQNSAEVVRRKINSFLEIK